MEFSCLESKEITWENGNDSARDSQEKDVLETSTEVRDGNAQTSSVSDHGCENEKDSVSPTTAVRI